MLSLMRKHAGSWLIKVILGAIVVVFVLWGVGSWTSQRSGRVATVNGDTITLDEYRIAYKRLIDQVRQSFGNNANEDLIKSLQLEHKALDQLVDNLLVRQAASVLGMQISDEDLSQSIRNIGAFQVAGVFDPRRYQLILTNNNLTPEAFENSQRDALLTQKLNSFITNSVKVTEQETVAWFKWNEASVNLNFYLLDTNRYNDIVVSDEDIQQYFESRKDAYKTDPAVKVRYLKFEPKTYVKQVEIGDDEISEYYNEHPAEFQNPKTVEARHILIKVDPNAGSDEVTKAKEQIESVLKKARDGQDFAELAKQFSEGPSKDQGGYLGTFRREAMVKAFSDKAFAMQAGEISDPVKTQFGWHIIKVEKVNEATTTSLSGAKDDIHRKLADDRSKNMAYDVAESVSDALFTGDQMESIAAERNLTIHTTGFVTRKGPAEGVQKKAEFAAVAFNLPDGEVSDIQDFGDGYYIVEVIEKRPAQIPELTSVLQKVKADLINEKKDEKAKLDADALLSALKDGVSFAEAGGRFNLKPAETGFFKRNDSLPNIGYEPEISRVAFELSEQNPLPQEVIKGSKGYYVIQFSQRKAPDLAEYEKEKAGIKERLLQQKRFKTFESWLEQVRNRSEIVVEKDFLKS